MLSVVVCLLHTSRRAVFFLFWMREEESIYAFWDENLNYLGNEQPQDTATSKERETKVVKEAKKLIKHVKKPKDFKKPTFKGKGII